MDFQTEDSTRPVTKKPHVCDFEGCGKSFTRAEHLRRHALNHQRGDNCCERCGVQFTRPDLLGRHMFRHAKRDEEAGAPGRGVLETRKRSRKGPDGKIVTRPSKRMIKAGLASLASPTDSAPSNERSPDSQHDEIAQPHRPLSPPHSADGAPPVDQAGTQNLLDVAIPFDMTVPSDLMGVDDMSWQMQPPVSMEGDMFDDIFNPDTANSFNMPFTTMSNYNWLFDTSMTIDPFYPEDAAAVPADSFTKSSSTGWPGPVGAAVGIDTSNPPQPLPTPSVETISEKSFGQVPLAAPPPTLQACNAAHATTGHSNISNLPVRAISGSDEASASSPGDMDYMVTNEKRSDPKQLLKICELARTRSLHVIAEVKPVTLQGTQIDETSPLLTMTALQEYLDLFFTRFNSAYPLIHQATFQPATVDPLLLVSVLLLGATYSTRDAHQMAVAIHDSLRPKIFSHPSFAAQPDLWVLQTLLLVECFGKSRAGMKQHDMSHLFHGLLINLIRRSECQVIHTVPAKARNDVQSQWRDAMEQESRKRLAFLCFMWDTQHAVLFSQSLCMSAFELRSSLPCDSATWEASSAEEWLAQSRHETDHPSFLKVLKGYITPDNVSQPRHLNALSRILLLHGLMSISWDLKRRDQTSLGAAGPETVGSWTGHLGRSYDLWKADFDADCMNMKLNLMYDLRKFTGLKIATHAIYHAAHIILNVEVLDLQIYAGAPHILGRAVGRGDFERSKKAVLQWRSDGSQAAAKTAWHGSRILNDAIMNLNDWDENDVFHYPWCLYLATLACWIFHLPTSTSTTGTPSWKLDDPQSEMTSLVVAMTSCSSVEDLATLAGKYDTSGLAKIMSKQLGTVRWAVIYSAIKVLNKLAER